MSPKTPVFLLKTKSSPGDAYEEIFSAPTDGFDFEPVFVPVLEHHFDEEGMSTVRGVVLKNSIGGSEGNHYGGLIFTSQRAVEAFSVLIQEAKDRGQLPNLRDIPVYSVGPATTRALRAVPTEAPLNIFGEHTGNGHDLSRFILDHYSEWYKDRSSKPPLLFLVGEQRRDIIPKVLRAASFQLDEIVIYKTSVMQSFKKGFEQQLQRTADCPRRWVVVFSPTGCDSMLSALDLLNETTGQSKPRGASPSTLVATIGSTTRDHLINKFAFNPEVCAVQPSPEGVWMGITQFSRTLV